MPSHGAAALRIKPHMREQRATLLQVVPTLSSIVFPEVLVAALAEPAWGCMSLAALLPPAPPKPLYLRSCLPMCIPFSTVHTHQARQVQVTPRCLHAEPWWARPLQRP
jgi:hypothetical protein